MIKNVIFDAGDILFKSTEYRMRAFKKILGKFRVSATDKEIKDTWNVFKKDAQIGKESNDEAVAKFFKSMGIKTRKLALTLFKRYYSEKRYKLNDGVIPTLKKMKRLELTIGVLTDSVFTAKNRQMLYNKLKIDKYIDKIASSHDIHVAKPDPKAFSTILKMMHAKKQNSVFVAHAKDELDGAKKFGLTTIGYNLDKGAKADFVARKFSDIIKIIGELND